MAPRTPTPEGLPGIKNVAYQPKRGSVSAHSIFSSHSHRTKASIECSCCNDDTDTIDSLYEDNGSQWRGEQYVGQCANVKSFFSLMLTRQLHIWTHVFPKVPTPSPQIFTSISEGRDANVRAYAANLTSFVPIKVFVARGTLAIANCLPARMEALTSEGGSG